MVPTAYVRIKRHVHNIVNIAYFVNINQMCQKYMLHEGG